jgi:hypothetical protein
MLSGMVFLMLGSSSGIAGEAGSGVLKVVHGTAGLADALCFWHFLSAADAPSSGRSAITKVTSFRLQMLVIGLIISPKT